MNSLCLPKQRSQSVKDFFFEYLQENLDHQSEICSELNLIYTQLSGGVFKGKVFNSNTGHVSIYKNFYSQATEMRVSVPSSSYCFCVLPEKAEPFFACGIELTRSRVYLLPPGGGSLVIVPANGHVTLCTISRDALIHNEGLIEEASDWLLSVERRGAVLGSSVLADRLRSDIEAALEGVENAEAPQAREFIDKSTAFRIASSFTMEVLRSDAFSAIQRPVSFERFWRARKLLLENHRTVKECGLQSLSGLGSRRSTEQAFAEHVDMGPLACYRVVRLHSVRRKLIDLGRLGQSIGDIASEEGFWDWSRFSTYYRRHFGVLPSDTRSRLQPSRR